MIKKSTKYTVIANTPYQFPIITFDTKREAYTYCDVEGWTFIDKNGVGWPLEIIEERENLDMTLHNYLILKENKMTTEFINNLKEKTKTAKEDSENSLIIEISQHDSELMKKMEEAAERGYNVVNVKYKLPTKYEVIKDKLKFILTSYYNRPDLEIRVEIIDSIIEIIDSIIMFGYDITIVW